MRDKTQYNFRDKLIQLVPFCVQEIFTNKEKNIMPVFRVDKSRDFTVVANCIFKDRSLSAKAKGILVEMLSLPESWDFTL